MPRAAIVVPAITQWVEETRALMADLREAEEAFSLYTRKLADATQTAQMRRMEVGRHLNKVRDAMPKRGTPEHGWGAFLEAVELDQATAWRYMEYAKATANLSPVKDRLPSFADLGINKREGAEPDPEAPPPRDEDAPRDAGEPIVMSTEDDVEIDRDTWCTPREFTEALGPVDLDPCANERSHVQAATSFDLELRGEDGLELAKTVKPETLTFLNPPYSNVMPWIVAYAHVRFCFLLKFDPSTKWFTELLKHTGLVLIPKGTRVQFEAPPGVPKNKSEANQFPHAFFFALEEDAPQALLDRCYVWRVESAA